MSFQDDKASQRKRKIVSEAEDRDTADISTPGRKKRGHADGVGEALRSAYQRTLREEIPPEMLDLLGKL